MGKATEIIFTSIMSDKNKSGEVRKIFKNCKDQHTRVKLLKGFCGNNLHRRSLSGQLQTEVMHNLFANTDWSSVANRLEQVWASDIPSETTEIYH